MINIFFYFDARLHVSSAKSPCVTTINKSSEVKMGMSLDLGWTAGRGNGQRYQHVSPCDEWKTCRVKSLTFAFVWFLWHLFPCVTQNRQHSVLCVYYMHLSVELDFWHKQKTLNLIIMSQLVTIMRDKKRSIISFNRSCKYIHWIMFLVLLLLWCCAWVFFHFKFCDFSEIGIHTKTVFWVWTFKEFH